MVRSGRHRPERLRAQVERLLDAVLTGEGRTPPHVRRDAFAGRADDPALQRFVGLVAEHAHRITAADVARLRETGMDDDAIFEVTVAAAAGAAATRLRAGMALLERDR